MSGPGWHLLLCGPPDAWPQEIRQLGNRHGGGLLTVHHLSQQKAPGVLYDPDGTAFHRLGLKPRDTALFLVRPDGHIGFHAGDADGSGFGALPRSVAAGRSVRS